MKMREKVAQLVESGAEPIMIQCDTVRFFDGTSDMKRSFLQINSLELGALSYRQYRFVARRSKQAEQLVRRHVHGLLRLISGMSEEQSAPIFTLPVYARTLQEGKLAQILFEGLALFPKAAPDSICIEISADILYEDALLARERLEALRDLGVRIAVGEVGDEYCPAFRLSAIPFTYAFLDEYAVRCFTEENEEQSVLALISYLHTLGVRVIAPDLTTQEQIERARTLGCDGYTSSREEVSRDGE